MKTVAIVYHSGMGNTARIAEAVAVGAEGVDGIRVERCAIVGSRITEGRWEDAATMSTLASSDAIVFGAPTYMGMVSGPFKCFADATAELWFSMAWKDKIAGGFTTSGYASGDKVMTLHYMATLAAQLRMVWVGPAAPPSNLTNDGEDIDRWEFYLGLGARGHAPPEDGFPDDGDIRTAEHYGARIARAALHWRTGDVAP